MILPPVAGGPISSYFRTHFDWRGPLDFVVLDFASAVDDGMIVYLNGRELLAFNMPPAPRPMVWDLAVLPSGPNPLGEGVPVVTNIVPSNLREGDNVIAVELHQHLFTTGDDLFGMKLTATFPQAPVNLAPDEPSNRVVLANRDFPPKRDWTGPAPSSLCNRLLLRRGRGPTWRSSRALRCGSMAESDSFGLANSDAGTR
ncbi:MAG TPA: hypothetical protein VNU68_30225 [Verrucomicrobiae bacterium]|nr:hypothetical protein [Verrucomicrobiae bacterium]